jgi:hypothetical protein
MDKEARLTRLKERDAELWTAEKHVSDAVISARMAGASWAEIGTALGMTKQGAHKKFSDKLPYQFPLPE